MGTLSRYNDFLFFIHEVLLVLIFLKSSVSLDLSLDYWKVSNSNGSIQMQGSVPGGIYSDLQNVAYLDDILYGENDVNYRWVAYENWAYSREFPLNKTDLEYKNVRLVLHGIDTVAEVFINNNPVTFCNNMFVRYVVDIKPFIMEGNNNISIKFISPIEEATRLASRLPYKIPNECTPSTYRGECHVNLLRKMQASFAWDWGPAFPSVGIWKPIEILISEGPIIQSVGVITTSEGEFWRLSVTAWFDPFKSDSDDVISAHLILDEKDEISTRKYLNIDKLHSQWECKMNFLVPKFRVKLWWPNGYGDQNLYKLKVTTSLSEKIITIAFRSIQLIQDNVSKNPKDGKHFYFLVNGMKVFAKGSNWIPSHVLPEKLGDPNRMAYLLESGARAHFNMLRVWGGGVYESDLFYQTCDRLGILIWQDLMFACNMYPASDEFVASVKTEVEQQIQRLQHHPSIAVWAGNNENEAALAQNWYGTSKNFSLYKKDYLKLYVSSIGEIVGRVDPSREYLTSSPSNGVESVLEGYVARNPQDSLYGDVHYYNYLSNGWDYRIYPRPRFASEYGVQSLPSISCLRGALPVGSLVWGSEQMEHRQHLLAGSIILTNQIAFNLPHPASELQDIVYLSQVNQAMTIKTETEHYRRLKSRLLDSGEGHTMGALYWQLNDIWQAPSWASIDYCGNWKMLHYFAEEFLAPLIVSPELSPDGSSVSVYVVSDGPCPHRLLNVSLSVYRWRSTAWRPEAIFSQPVVVLRENEALLGLKVSTWDALSYCGGDRKECFFSLRLAARGDVVAPENFMFLTPPKEAYYPSAQVNIARVVQTNEQTVQLTLSADSWAVFVWLENTSTQKGTFSKNGFHMLTPTTIVNFTLSSGPILPSTLNQFTVTWLKTNYT